MAREKTNALMRRIEALQAKLRGIAAKEFPRGTEFNCQRCDGTWTSTQDGLPRFCGVCKSGAWTTKP